MIILPSCLFFICSCKVFLGSTFILCGPSNVYGGLWAKEGQSSWFDLGGNFWWFGFFSKEGSKFLCRKSSSSLGMIPNFCLGSQPSRIPLILHGLPYGFQPIEAPYIVFHLFFFFYSCSPLFFFLFFLFFSFVFSLLSSSFFRYGYKRDFSCFILLLCPSVPTILGILGTAIFKMT